MLGGGHKRREVVHAHRTEVIASHSELLSLHCPRHLLLLALLPACAGLQVIVRQDCSAYAEERASASSRYVDPTRRAVVATRGNPVL